MTLDYKPFYAASIPVFPNVSKSYFHNGDEFIRQHCHCTNVPINSNREGDIPICSLSSIIPGLQIRHIYKESQPFSMKRPTFRIVYRIIFGLPTACHVL